MGASCYVVLPECVLLRLTDRAALVRTEDDGEEHWLPLSQMAPGEEERLLKLRALPAAFGSLTITEWIARQKGIEFGD